MRSHEALLFSVSCLLLAACVEKDAADSSAADTAPEEAPPPTHRVLSGSATWTWDFDEEAEGNGYTDCSYTRNYQGVEDSSAPWLCPACDEMWRLDVTLEPGGEDCLYQLTYSTTPSSPEWIGLADSVMYRGADPYPLVELPDSLIIEGDQATWTGEASGELTLSNGESLGWSSRETAGGFQIAEAEGDPLHDLTPPEAYTCGWPNADPEPYAGDYVLAQGATLPDGVFRDQCDEGLRLHDLKGRYLVLAIGAPDCPPCVEAAAGLAGVEEELAEAGIEVMLVELMAAGVSDSLSAPSVEDLQTWASTHELSSPVLADRAWGWYIGYQSTGEQGIPKFVIVDPELTVIDWLNGYASGVTRGQIVSRVSQHAAP